MVTSDSCTDSGCWGWKVGDVKVGEYLVDAGQGVVNKLNWFFIREVINARKGGRLHVQTSQLFQFPIPMADVGLFQVFQFDRVIGFLRGTYFVKYFVTEGLLEVSDVVEGPVLLLHYSLNAV